ncbi:hypothetical protein J7337_013759 [Fusarium musae]|uniref:Uncharacterized protein n=1 Tax=Fusarium musae TaxID=1042133 RepID=A0A9P8D543_9HYPO|nr:hypothetical protein J7337_013759 [Fusarium musae]KAG9495510.1 hypothetical protein J7337_013759 [Fusarium musae]
MSSMIDSDQYREECFSYDSRYLTTTSPPWNSLSEERQDLIKKELQYMFFEEIALHLRSGDEYAVGWYATSDLPVARYRHPAQVDIDREEAFQFLNKEIAVYIDTATVQDMDLGYLGRYLYRAWLHLHNGRPPFQRGGFLAKPLRISKKHTGSLDELSSFHGDLTRTLSIHLDDHVQFEQGRDHSTITPQRVNPSVQSLKDHGYLMGPLFRAIYIVVDNQSLAGYTRTLHVPERENGDWMALRSQFRANQVSGHTVLLVKTGDDSHLASPISFLPLFDAGLALNVNREDYQDEEEPEVVRVKIDDAISFIWDLTTKEMDCNKNNLDLAESLRQEQDMHCQAWKKPKRSGLTPMAILGKLSGVLWQGLTMKRLM